jgi:hypothetical protein
MSLSRYVNGWILTGWTALFVAVLSFSLLVSGDFSDLSLHAVIRWTARVSAALFLGAFLARPLLHFFNTASTRWLRRNRRYLGVSFAVSHTFHLAAILWLVFRSSSFRKELDPVATTGGVLGYLVLYAMTATSFDRTARWIGPKAWRWLHGLGLYYLWFIFFFTYLGNFSRSWIYATLAFLFLAALGLRWAARGRPKSMGPAEW